MAKKEDNAFYDILGVPRTATVAQIRKGYYNQARIWHPDKNPDDPTSEERFKRISQAYQVLSDPNLREVYDKQGEAGLKAKIEGGGMQLADVLDALFGGGAFEPIFGSVATLALVQQLVSGPLDEKEDPDKANERRAQQVADESKICNELAATLLERINTAFTLDQATFKKNCFEFANELCDAPGGIELLQMVAYAYVQKAKQHSNQFFARVGASLAEKGHQVSTVFSIGKHILGARKAAKQLEKGQKEQEEERLKALELQKQKRKHEFLYGLRSEGQPFVCMRCKAVMLAPLNLPKGALVTCSTCNGTQPLNLLFPPLDQWTCVSCSHVNDGGTKCAGCEALRPPRVSPSPAVHAPAAPSQSYPPPATPFVPLPFASASAAATPMEAEWTCSACTLVNPTSVSQCSVCNNKRPLPMAIPLAGPQPASVAPLATLIHIPPMPPSFDFQVGDTVMVTGLVKRPELNGQIGVVVELPDGREKSRCMIKLMDAEDTILSLKPDNVTKADDDKNSTPQQAALQQKLASEGLSLAWKTGKMFLEGRVRKIVESVFTMDLATGEREQKEQKSKRVQALTQIGTYYQEAATAFKEKLAKEGKEEQNLLKGLAQMAGGDAEETAKAAAQAAAAAAAVSARREAAAERKSTPIASEPRKESTGSRRNSVESERRRSSTSANPVSIHSPLAASEVPPQPTQPSVDDTD